MNFAVLELKFSECGQYCSAMYNQLMTSEIRKITHYLLIAALVLAPVRATWAVQNDVTNHTVHSNMSMAMDSADAAEAECCCSEDACVLKGCDSCNSVNPMVLAPDYVARILKIQVNKLSLNVTVRRLLKVLSHRAARKTPAKDYVNGRGGLVKRCRLTMLVSTNLPASAVAW